MSQTLKVGNERRLVTLSFSILLDFTVVVNKSLKSIQGLSTLVNEQTQTFQKLASDLREEGRVQGPLIHGETVQPTEDRYINGSYYAVEEGTLEFIQNADLFVVESMDKLKDSHPDQYLEILHCVRVMYVDAVVGIKKIMIERDESNVGVNRLPPVLPSELARMSRAVFNDLFVLQRPRLGAFYSEDELISIGREFKGFLSQLRHEPEFKEMILGQDGMDFDDAWSLLRKRYPLMCQFFGGLASVFPGTSTVESDFSIIGYEKDDYRQALTNFSLEGVMQCKQFELLGKIMALVNNN